MYPNKESPMAKRVSLTVTLLGMFIGMLVLTSALLIGVMLYYATGMAAGLTNHTLQMKIDGDIRAARLYLERHYGSLSMIDGHMHAAKGVPIEDGFSMVDSIADDLGVVATVFARQGEDFRRISTNIRKQDGQRAVNTMLGTGSAAYASVSKGTTYLGQADILGKPYLTAYDPILDVDSSVIGILFLGIPQTEVQNIASETMKDLLRGIAFTLLIVICGAFGATYLFTSRLSRRIMSIVSLLSENSSGVHLASEQVSQASQSLAMRSAETAKDTSVRIRESVVNAQRGVAISVEVREALEKIVDGITKTRALVSDITVASGEQAKGIDQVNRAVAQMEEVTQKTAANAEESASTSEDLRAQAVRMRAVVDDLLDLVQGSSGVRVARTKTGLGGRALVSTR